LFIILPQCLNLPLKKNTDLHTPTEDLNLQTHIFFATIEQHKGEVCVEDMAPTHLVIFHTKICNSQKVLPEKKEKKDISSSLQSWVHFQTDLLCIRV
jgi:hypothetical protein